MVWNLPSCKNHIGDRLYGHNARLFTEAFAHLKQLSCVPGLSACAPDFIHRLQIGSQAFNRLDAIDKWRLMAYSVEYLVTEEKLEGDKMETDPQDPIYCPALTALREAALAALCGFIEVELSNDEDDKFQRLFYAAKKENGLDEYYQSYDDSEEDEEKEDVVDPYGSDVMAYMDGFIFWDRDWEMEKEVAGNKAVREYANIEKYYFNYELSLKAARERFPTFESIITRMDQVYNLIAEECGNNNDIPLSQENLEAIVKRARQARGTDQADEEYRKRMDEQNMTFRAGVRQQAFSLELPNAACR